MKLSQQAEEALIRIRALRKLGSNPSTQRAERKILEEITLREVADVALVLSQDSEATNGKA
jgi:hypothetical protein